MAFASVTALGRTAIATSGVLYLPGRGLWVANCDVDSDTDLLDQPVTLRVGDLTHIGTVIAGGVYQTRGTYRIVGGFGGWRKVIPAASLQGPLGRLATIVEGAARLVGEVVRVEDDRVIGPYVRHAGPASRVLGLAEHWHVDPEGTTVIGPRPTVSYQPRVLGVHVSPRVVEVYEDKLIVPGTRFEAEGLGPVTVLAAFHSFSGGSRLYV